MSVIDAVKETIADISSTSPSSMIRCDEGLALETPAIVSSTASITLISTQLIHQLVFHYADAAAYSSLRAGITLSENEAPVPSQVLY